MLSGKVLDEGPCTPFDPAPLGLAHHEAQGEELVSTPVFITAGLKRTIRTKYNNDRNVTEKSVHCWVLVVLASGSRAHLNCSGTLGLFILLGELSLL